MSPVAWRDVRLLPGTLAAEAATAPGCLASLSLIRAEGLPAPYVVSVKVDCTGRKPWTSTKSYRDVTAAFRCYARFKDKATALMTENG